MKECKRFYYDAREDCTWTIFYADNSRSIVEELPIAYDCIGNTSAVFSLLENVSQDYPIECSHWNFENDGCLCPILINKKWGFINSKFQIVIQPIFDFVGTEIEDSNGPCYRPPMYYHETKWVNGECKVVMNGKEQYIKEKDYCIGDSNYVIETKTNYAYRLKYMDDPTFDKVRDLAVKFYRELPQELQDDLYNALNRGVDILDSEPQMTAYMFSFGKMHQAKLEYAFSKLPEEFLEEPEINIIDYGCGQALGTICYADFLREKGCSQKVKTITLIEPSEICLKRAALHSSVFFPDAAIKTVNKKFDDLTIDDIVCDEETPTLHILSNVLDMLNFDLDSFAELVKDCLIGYNQFVCVGPYFNHSVKDDRMNVFCSLLEGITYFNKIYDKYEFEESITWTAHFLGFTVGALSEEYSTEVTSEDYANGIEDEYRIIYSNDGKRLLGYNCECLKEEYHIKEGTKVICDDAFHDRLDIASDLKKIVLPNSISHIGDWALSCFTLQYLNIPDSVESIGKNAFSGCDSLQQIIIPKGSKEKFKKMLPLELWDRLTESFFTEATNEDFESGVEDALGVVYSRDGKKLLRWDEMKCRYDLGIVLVQYTISEGTKVICDAAFYSCRQLRQITIPDSVANIGSMAFYDCVSLQQIILPDSITSIGDKAFMYCSHLRQITIPDSVTSIGSSAFWHCSSLQKFTISNSIEHIGSNPFNGCDNLILESKSARFIVTNEGLLIDTQCNNIISYLRKDKYITISDPVASIGDSAFYECVSLQQITIPDSVTTIGNCAFFQCKSLQQFTISNSIKIIGGGAFSGCENLILKNRSTRFIVTDDGLLIDKQCNSIISCIGKEKFFTIPDSVTSIDKYAFYGCKSMIHVTIPNSVISIGDNAFPFCLSLGHILIPEGSEEKFKNMLPHELWDRLTEMLSTEATDKDIENGIEDDFGVVYSKDGKRLLKCKNFDLAEYTIKDNTLVVCNDAFSYRWVENMDGYDAPFYRPRLKKIEIPYGVKMIGNGAFSYQGITEIHIPSSVMHIGDAAFSTCRGLSKVCVPDTIKTINRALFCKCSLQKVILPEAVVSIGDSAFRENNELQCVIIPNNVTSIGTMAFLECKSLAYIDIPDSVTFIGDKAFNSCASLKHIILPDSITSIGDGAFGDCNSLQQIIIPKGSAEKYKQMLPKELWDKLYYLSKAEMNYEDKCSVDP